MRKAGGIFVILFAAVATIGVAISHSTGEERKLALPLPRGMPTAPVGIKALMVGSDPSAPFTREEIAAYFEKHNLPRNSGSKTDIKVEKLEFITTKEVRDRLSGAGPDRGEDVRVGFATLRGPFVFSGPPPDGKSVKFEYAYAIFDASSGNLLMAGTLD
jgi:hypothetical protein